MNKFKKIFTLSIIATILVQFSIATVQALALADTRFYESNTIVFYSRDATDCAAGQQSLKSNIQITKTENITKIHSYLTKTKLSANNDQPLSDVQVAGIMGNMFATSGFNSSAIEVTERSDKGHGLLYWTFDRWTNLENFAKETGESWDDTTTQLEFLKAELEGSEAELFEDDLFTSAKEPAIAAMRFHIIFQRGDPNISHDEKREGAAISIYQIFGGKAEVCTGGNGIVAGNAVKTALGLALETPAPNGTTKESQARASYLTAKKEFNKTTWVDVTDCGGFIATVMHASGADPDFPDVGTDVQTAYVRNNSDKYIINENPKLADLQPGDILYVSGHVTMYTGEEKYPSVDASLYERVPSVRDASSATWMISHGAISARLIK